MKMRKKIYILTGDDEWLTGVLIKKLQYRYNVFLVKVNQSRFDIIKKIKLSILVGLLDLTKILFNHYKIKKFKILKIDKKNLDSFIKKINKNKIFLVNYPYKINHKLKNIYNCHPSLLPNYKGVLPIIKQFFDLFVKKKKTAFGITIHKLNKNYDDGQIIWNKSINLDLKSGINIKNVYELIYSNFFYGIDNICKLKKIKYKKIKKIKSLKKSFSFYDTILLKIKLI